MSIRRDDSGGVITSFFGARLPRDSSALSFLDTIPLRKIIIWVSFLGLLYLLKDFFGILIGTFVISYIGNSIINRLETRYPNRKLLIIGYFLSILLLISGFGFWAVTLAVEESKVFIEKIQKEDPYKTIYKEMNTSLPPAIMSRIDQSLLEISKSKDHSSSHSSSAMPHGTEDIAVAKIATGFVIALGDGKAIEIDGQGKIVKRLSDYHPPVTKDTGTEEDPVKQQTPSKTTSVKTAEKTATDKADTTHEMSPQQLEQNVENLGKALQKALKDYASLAIKYVSKFFGVIGKAIIQTIISLIFAFMIVWDLPKIKIGMAKLESSRLGEAYRQVAPSVVNFGQLLGKAFQAQTLIALVNTGLTALGMALMFIPGIGFLSIIVFGCSFIPVAGVFISTAPMALVALVNGGIVKCLGVIVMVIVVHAVEAYILNPVIYSAHLKLHPLLVLVVLVVAEHLFGVWGLIIAVPFTVYVYKHVIMGNRQVPPNETETSLIRAEGSTADSSAAQTLNPSPENDEGSSSQVSAEEEKPETESTKNNSDDADSKPDQEETKA